MNRLAVASLLLFLLTGCAPVAWHPPSRVWDPRFEGTYRGIVTLAGPIRPGDPTPRQGTVEICFNQGGYSVKGDVRYLPPASGGTYELGDQLILFDDGFHSCEFDASLLLKGPFAVSWNGEDLRMEQVDPAGHHWLITAKRASPPVSTVQ